MLWYANNHMYMSAEWKNTGKRMCLMAFEGKGGGIWDIVVDLGKAIVQMI